jgi:hypothetical protein
MELIAYALLIAGVLADHISTAIATAKPWIHEANPYAAMYMELGIWLPVDLLLVATGIAFPALIIRLWSFPHRRVVLLYPMIHGAARLIACIWNLSLL